MKTKSTTTTAFFNLRIILGLTLCSAGLLLDLAALSHTVTGTAVTTPDATKWYVDGVNGSDSNDCKSRTTACKTIGHAISLASSGDSIQVAAAIYAENLTIGISLKLTGAGATTTIIDGGAISSVITVNSGPVTLSGLTIQNGYASSGGGIYNSGTLTIKNSTITQNHATKPGNIFHKGGGIYNEGGLTISNCTISQNSAALGFLDTPGGGGIYNVNRLTINNSTVSENTAPIAAGIYNDSALTITGSTISGNSASSGFNSGSVIDQGGGIYNTGTLTLTNSTLSGNSVISHFNGNCFPTYGGGIYSRGTITIINSTLSGNYAIACAGAYGGGIYSSANGSVILQNSIVANSSSGGNCSGTMTSNGYNVSSDGTCNFTGPGDLNNTDPILGPLQNNGGPTQTIALGAGSPAIDAGNPGGCTDGQGHLLTTDQRGMPRPDPEDTGGCDMGAYESQSD